MPQNDNKLASLIGGEELSILFADIAGSTSLYDKIGDKLAYPKIVEVLNLMKELVNDNGGIVVETIGDEIMCQFEEANDAVTVANLIQRKVAENLALNVRIGIHSGLAGMHNGHPFGDVVNVAARMTSLAKAGRIIISEDTTNNLDPLNSSYLRVFDHVQVKGKANPITTYEVVWDLDDSTSFDDAPIIQADNIKPSVVTFKCHYQSTHLSLNAQNPKITIGRKESSDICIDSRNVSREHATIELLGGQVIFTDHSTNGSHFKIKHQSDIATMPIEKINTKQKLESDQYEFKLHRDEWMVTDNGVICIGESISDDCELIHFEYIPN